MKRTLAISLAIALLAGGAFAQAFPDLAGPFQDFTDALNPALPVNATIGSAWSDAYMGGFPHFGVGLAFGATTIPSDSIDQILTAVGVDATTVPGLEYVTKYGLPVPAAALTARLGGLILPFDVGVKIGTIPEQLKEEVASVLPAGTELNYFLAGADVRFAIWEEKKDFMDFSIGLGVDYLDGTVSLPIAAAEQSFTFTTPDAASHTIALTSPKLYMDWNTVAADLTVQASKRILILTPYLGAGVSFGKPTLSTGLSATATLDGTAITQADIDALKQAYLDNGQTPPAELDSFSATGYSFDAAITDWVDGMDYRVFGGLSVDLLIVRLDLTGSYNFIGKNLGGTVGLRVQL